jgi:hypothetical protein
MTSEDALFGAEQDVCESSALRSQASCFGDRIREAGLLELAKQAGEPLEFLQTSLDLSHALPRGERAIHDCRCKVGVSGRADTKTTSPAAGRFSTYTNPQIC